MKKLVSLTILFLISCSPQYSHVANNDALAHIKSNLEFLASDELEGREATRAGSRTAAKFLATKLNQFGYAPAGDSGTYFQEFDLQETNFLKSSTIAFSNGPLGSLEIGTNFIPFAAGKKITDSEIIFVGYGITDTSLNYDDYAGLDVNGKTVVAVYGVPRKKDDPDYFKKGRRWGGSSGKARTAEEHGAAAIIILQSNFWVKNWQGLADRNLSGSVGRINEDNPQINAGWIDTTNAKTLLGLNDLSYRELLDTLNAGLIPSGSVFDTKVSMEIFEDSRIVKARNVIGIIAGKPSAENRVTILGAHYDHEGIRSNGDIYNGADDNASGTTAALEAARQLALKKLDRPVMVCFWDAEEKGLLGAEYFVKNYEDSSNIHIYINMDMVGREHPDTIYVMGPRGISDEFGALVDKVNEESVRFNLDYSFDDVDHPDRPYQRSDHWPFAKINIPFVSFADKHRVDYHKPTDTADKINFAKVLKVSTLATGIALKVTNLGHNLNIDRLVDYSKSR